MPDLSQYSLSDSFKGAVGYPKVGETYNGKQILAAWVNEDGFLKGYKLKCNNCSEISEFVYSRILKRSATINCRHCKYDCIAEKLSHTSSIWFKQNYDRVTAENLCALYHKKEERHNGPKFYELWKTDFKAFAEYVVPLENFDKHPQYQMDRIDNSKGYEPGNIRFVTRRDNVNNRSNTRFIEFKNKKYPFADFIRLIVGEDIDQKIYKFVDNRIYYRPRPLTLVLRELYDNHSVWPNEATEAHYCDWYESQFQAKPRKY